VFFKLRGEKGTRWVRESKSNGRSRVSRLGSGLFWATSYHRHDQI